MIVSCGQRILRAGSRAKRIALVELVHVRVNMVRLAFEEASDCIGEGGMREPVRGARDGRQKAARHLVIALGAALERPELFFDAEFERLVVRGLEVQAGHVFQRAPVASVQRAAAGLPAGLRVGLIGSGGLSHEPGGARYYVIDEEFDRWFLDLCCAGDHRRLREELTIERMEAAGSGGTSELLAWVVVMGAIGERRGRSFGYALHRDFRCGIGAVLWDVGQA